MSDTLRFLSRASAGMLALAALTFGPIPATSQDAPDGRPSEPIAANGTGAAQCRVPLAGLAPGAELVFEDASVPQTRDSAAERRVLRLSRDVRVRTAGGLYVTVVAAGPGARSEIIIDRYGVAEVHYTVRVAVPRCWMVPAAAFVPGELSAAAIDPDARVEVTTRYDAVRGEHAIVPSNWIARGPMPPGALPGPLGATFRGGEFVIDQSTSESSDDRADPEWTGVEIRHTQLELSSFTQAGSENRLRLPLDRVWFSDGGANFTVLTGARTDVRIGDWSGRLRHVTVRYEDGRPVEASASGALTLPEFDNAMSWAGSLLTAGNDSEWIVLALGQSEDVRMERWKSQVDVSGGWLRISRDGHRAEAQLSGSLSVDSTIGSTTRISLQGIHFEGMVVRTGSREIQQPVWSHASPQHGLGAYPFSLTEIGPAVRESGRSALRFSFGLNLAENRSAILGIGELDVLEDIIGPQLDIGADDIEYNDTGHIAQVYLEGISLTDAMTIRGHLAYFESDTTYGDGWYGKVECVILKAGARVVGQFGTMHPGTAEQYRYWFFDTYIRWPSGIAIGTTGAGWYGIRGGLWYHMRRDSVGYPEALDPALGTVPRAIGQSVSGYKFKPDSTMFGGLKIGGVFGSYPDPGKAMCDIALAGTLTSSNSLAEIGIEGEVGLVENMLDKIKKVYKNFKGFASGMYKWTVRFNCNLQLEPEFQLAVALGGSYSALPFKVEGDAALKLAESEWYFMVGRPDRPVTASFLWVIKFARGYLMMGSNLPPAPLEGAVKRFFPDIGPLFPGGAGFAVGAEVGVDWSGSWHGLGYDIALGLGFGFSLARYDAPCGDDAGIGVNGWYGLGRLYGYAYFGIDLWGWTPHVSATAILYGGAPNPWWLKGRVKVRWLGSFSFSLGSPPRTCDPKLALPSDFIKDLSPGDGDTASVFTWETASLQAGIGEEFTVELRTLDLDNPDKPPVVYRLRPVVKEFTLKRLADTLLPTSVACDRSESLEDRTVTLAPRDALEGEIGYRARIVVVADCLDTTTKKWTRWMDGTTEVSAVRQEDFQTRARPRVIPEENIAFTTPLQRQRHFYASDGTGPGRVHLKTGATYLLGPPAQLVTRFTPINGGAPGTSREVPASLRAKAIDYQIPALDTATFYRADVVRKGSPGSGGTAIPDSVALTWFFRTSTHRALADKIAALPLDGRRNIRDTGWIDVFRCAGVSDTLLWGGRMPSPVYPELTYGIDPAGEGFDQYELLGLTYDVGFGPARVPPLLHVRSLAVSPWHVGFYQDTVLRLVGSSLRTALASSSCGAAMAEAAGAFAHLRTLLLDSLRPRPLLSDEEITRGRSATLDNSTGRLAVEYRDELVAWRFWVHAVLVDSCMRISCSTMDPALKAALAVRWRPLDTGRYEMSAWCEPRWWKAQRIGGDFPGQDPLVIPGILSFDYNR